MDLEQIIAPVELERSSVLKGQGNEHVPAGFILLPLALLFPTMDKSSLTAIRSFAVGAVF